MASQIESLESELADLASSEFDRQIKLLTSIKEIGITLATALIVATGGFSYFDNAKQISRFIGICPTYQQSGTSVHIKGGINRNGDVSLRSLLYVASWSALRGNTTCKVQTGCECAVGKYIRTCWSRWNRRPTDCLHEQLQMGRRWLNSYCIVCCSSSYRTSFKMFKENSLSFLKTAVVNNIYENVKNDIKNYCSDYIDYRMLL